jgi:hypothetical protein
LIDDAAVEQWLADIEHRISPLVNDFEKSIQVSRGELARFAALAQVCRDLSSQTCDGRLSERLRGIADHVDGDLEEMHRRLSEPLYLLEVAVARKQFDPNSGGS